MRYVKAAPSLPYRRIASGSAQVPGKAALEALAAATVRDNRWVSVVLQHSVREHYSPLHELVFTIEGAPEPARDSFRIRVTFYAVPVPRSARRSYRD